MRCCAVLLGVGVLMAWSATQTNAKEPAEKASEKEAAELVAKALEAELRGDIEQRQVLLDQAIKTAPKYAPARWQSGQVSHRGKWTPVEAVVRDTESSEVYAQYRELRKRYSGNAQGELLLARWCHKNKLHDEAQIHWGTLLQLDPENADAAKALGLQRFRGRWLAAEQIEELKEAEQQFEADRDYWKPRLSRWVEDIDRRNGEEREMALTHLRAIDDVAAIPFLEAIVSKRSEELGKEVVELLARRKEHAAIASLVRHALLSPFEGVRRAAIDRLKARPLELFVGPLVEGLTAPPELEIDGAAEAAPVRAPSLVRLSVSARVETMTDVRELDSTFRGVSFSGQFGPEAFLGLAERWALVGQLNALETINLRICELLEGVTGQRFGRDEKKWWQWWADHNESVLADGAKPVRMQDQQSFAYANVELIPGPPDLPQQTEPKPATSEYKAGTGVARTPPKFMGYFNGGMRFVMPSRYGIFPVPRYSCFAAGTVVHTKTGTLPIEELRPGDTVLSQDVGTGELTYKPVLQTTLRPPSKILALMIDGEPIGCTRGHPFWVVGAGWTMAKDLRQGDRVHSLGRGRLIESVREIEEEPAYNLIVADFRSYFVGEQAVLVHDNSPVHATNCVLPGFIDAEAYADVKR